MSTLFRSSFSLLLLATILPAARAQTPAAAPTSTTTTATAGSGEQWGGLARRMEGLGYASLLIPVVILTQAALSFLLMYLTFVAIAVQALLSRGKKGAQA